MSSRPKKHKVRSYLETYDYIRINLKRRHRKADALNYTLLLSGLRPAILWGAHDSPDNWSKTKSLLKKLNSPGISYMQGRGDDNQKYTLIYRSDNKLAPKITKDLMRDHDLLGRVLGYPCPGELSGRYEFRVWVYSDPDSMASSGFTSYQMLCDSPDQPELMQQAEGIQRFLTSEKFSLFVLIIMMDNQTGDIEEIWDGYLGARRNPSPSIKSMKEVFYEIAAYSKKEGCPVTVHINKSKVHGSNGYFSPDPKPHIQVALKGKTWGKAIELLIHEHCHYWQWKEDWIKRYDDEGNMVYSDILDGKRVSPELRERARKLIQLSEYNCEIRAAALFKAWNLESVFPPENHIMSANTYNRHIAWSVGSDASEGSRVFMPTYDKVAPYLWSKKFTHFWNPETPEGQAMITAPISEEHKKAFDKAMKKS